MIIFTREIAMKLLSLGFLLEYKTDTFWCFEDSEELEVVAARLIEALS